MLTGNLSSKIFLSSLHAAAVRFPTNSNDCTICITLYLFLHCYFVQCSVAKKTPLDIPQPLQTMVTTRSSKDGSHDCHGDQQLLPIVNDAVPPLPPAPPGQCFVFYGDPAQPTHNNIPLNQHLPSDGSIVDAPRLRQCAAQEKHKPSGPRISRTAVLNKDTTAYRQLLTPERQQVDMLHDIDINGDITSVDKAVSIINLPQFYNSPKQKTGNSTSSRRKRSHNTRNYQTKPKSIPYKKKKRAPSKPSLRPRKKVLLPSEIANASPTTAGEAEEAIRRRAAAMRALTSHHPTTLSRAHSSPAVLLVTPKACGSMFRHRDSCSSKRKLSYQTTIESQITSAATRWEQKLLDCTPNSSCSTKTTEAALSTTVTANSTQGKLCDEQQPKQPLPIYSPPALVRMAGGETTAAAPTAVVLTTSAIAEEDLGQPLSENMLASLFAWTELSPNVPPLHASQNLEEQRIQVVSSPLVTKTPPIRPYDTPSTGMTPPLPSDNSVAHMEYTQDELHNLLFQLDDDDDDDKADHSSGNGNNIFRNDSVNLTPVKLKANPNGMTNGGVPLLEQPPTQLATGRYFDVQPDTPISSGAAYAGASSAIHGTDMNTTTCELACSSPHHTMLSPVKKTLSQDMADLFGLESPI